MKTLILIRHAKSAWDVEAQSDYDRTLNARGLADAPVMGERLSQRLAQNDQKLDALISSSAVRAEQTTCLLAQALCFPEQSIDWRRELYLASPRTMQDLVRELPEDVKTVALVAHNPGVSDLVEKLTGEFFGDVPTCSVITIAFPVSHWLDTGSWADFVDYDYPKKV